MPGLFGGWSGGAKVPGKLSVRVRPTNMDSKTRASCAYGRSGRGCLELFSLVYLFSFLSPSVGDGPI